MTVAASRCADNSAATDHLIVVLGRQRVEATSPTAVFAADWPAAAITWSALQSAHIGWRDEWRAYPLAHTGAVTVGAIMTAVGCAGIGRRLISEDPVTGMVAS